MSVHTAPLPGKGELIEYKRTNGRWRLAYVDVVWNYDGDDILTLSDGARIIPSFGDQWRRPQPPAHHRPRSGRGRRKGAGGAS
jgi:hypothetical protein